MLAHSHIPTLVGMARCRAQREDGDVVPPTRFTD